MAEYKKSIAFGSALAIIAASILAGSSIYLARNSSTSTSSSTFQTSATTSTVPNNYNPSSQYFYCANRCTIVIKNDIYGNDNPTLVAKGTNITWLNQDSTQHTITSDTAAFSSHILNPEQNFSLVFNQDGNFSYHDLIHPMNGQIVVEEQSSIEALLSSSTVSSGHTDSGSNNTCTSPVTISGYTQLCAEPLNYTTFQQLVNEASSIEHQNGTIILTVGYHPCIEWFYVLPNATNVEVYRGTVNASQTCA